MALHHFSLVMMRSNFYCRKYFCSLCEEQPRNELQLCDKRCTGLCVTVDDDVIDINVPTLNPPVITNADCYTVCNGQISLTGTNIANYQITSSGGQ